MTILELATLLTSSGVCAGGIGVLRWMLRTERRLMVLEVNAGIASAIT